VTAVAVVPVRDGTLPAGADETVAESDGQLVLIGDDAARALEALVAPVDDVLMLEAGPFGPARYARALAEAVAVRDASLVLLPASPDGRDLAPRLARALHRPLLTGAVRATDELVTVVRYGGRVEEDHAPAGPLVVTLEPGSRNVDAGRSGGARRVRRGPEPAGDGTGDSAPDARCVEVLAPDPATMDLAEAPVIVAGGAGLGAQDEFARLERVAAALGASVGATRVVTDAGWVGHERQIGTTGVTVSPRVYVALGISGAVQHTGGIGHPDHVVSVNLDASCPMMAMADLAVVTDARALLEALERRLG
jgi:electron transfer flavoprotein alpha subunit